MTKQFTHEAMVDIEARIKDVFDALDKNTKGADKDNLLVQALWREFTKVTISYYQWVDEELKPKIDDENYTNAALGKMVRKHVRKIAKALDEFELKYKEAMK